MNPKVSIIIPTYNTEKYIAQAITSALEQTERNIEVIVVDDASTDSTVEVVRGFTDERLKLFVNERNGGPSYTRNRALKEARGEWIALLDSDDWFAPERIERLLHIAYEENADLIADDMYWIKDGSDSPWNTTLSLEKICFNQPIQIDSVYFLDFNLSITKPLIKRSFLLQHGLEFNEALRYEEDLLLFLMCLLNGANFVIVPEQFYFYRNRMDSLTTEYQDFFEQAYKTNSYLLQQELVKNNPKLVHSLSRRLLKMKRTRAFCRVRKFIKKGALLGALAEAVQNPSFFLALWVRLPGILKYHFSRHFTIRV
ncbi:glycosyltransferase family 2 protein [Scytonema sp. PCC 10023]|uniref:glycosyltransferase family 2 protein n=1 Tax=Scytonema sp. PCC 10023 TaxID=1680591 RepID=UPI0039C65E81